MYNKDDYINDSIVITNRKLVEGDYLALIESVVLKQPYALILREKDLSDEEYEGLAKEVFNICHNANVPFFLHSRFNIATKIGCENIHLSVDGLDALKDYRDRFSNVSVACHSIIDVRKAIEAGATQIILGTIFETQCKPGLEGRGLLFVKEICDYVKKMCDIPVFAIGGITPDNMPAVKAAGARGGCMMSYFMKKNLTV